METKEFKRRQTIRSIVRGFSGRTNGGKPIDVRALEKQLVSNTRNCSACEARPSDAVAAFVPSDPAKFGGVEGRDRILFYGVCDPCMENPRLQEIMEMRILLGTHPVS